MNSGFAKGLLLLSLLAMSLPAAASELVMTRIENTFPETMNMLQESIRKQGYTISRVQRVDVGLTKMGFKTAEYRIVFYGKPKEIRELSERYPDLVPYLPLKIVIFAENNDTLLLSANPQLLDEFFPQYKLGKQIQSWSRDLNAIFSNTYHASEGQN